MFSEQRHDPLMFLSGTFSGSANPGLLWKKKPTPLSQLAGEPTISFIVRMALPFIPTAVTFVSFSILPVRVFSSVPKYTADKLQRWALLLMAHTYDICDISGDENVWADLLSRWGSSLPRICAVRLVPCEYSPTLNNDFQWPTMNEILTCQQIQSDRTGLDLHMDEESVLRVPAGPIWIPSDAGSLQLRLCAIGHFGVGGYRDLEAAIVQRFWWDDIEPDVEYFVRRCPHCVRVVGGPPTTVPLGEALHAERPNELIHWDYFLMGDTSSAEKYILVIKYDAFKTSVFCCARSQCGHSKKTYVCLLESFSVFGVCTSWVSDQGIHFKNEAIKALQHALGAHHHFTTARCPWANGTVEVVVREALRCFRSLLSEWWMSTCDWPRLAKVVQLVLNQCPVKSLGAKAPVSVMTGLPALSPLDAIALSPPLKHTTMSELTVTRDAVFADLQRALEAMHKSAASASRTAREKGRKHHRGAGAGMARMRLATMCSSNGVALVLNAVSAWIFSVKNLTTGDVRDVHVSRLKVYSDNTLNITEDLLRHIAHNSEGHVVAQLLDSRYNTANKRFKLLVNWRDLSEAEDSWDPAATLLEDVPVMVKNFVRAQSRSATAKKLAAALGLKSLLSNSSEGRC
ncbi:LOW QUALITY PROTEIN: Chromodomain containing hypothetical protein [Phytophthora palmivora]|uniref:Integrase catalytic domain-containing protein n=1 Tax=Phytophthora palmivora TaxID=4796 RepID=A0A2P4YM11_9STRA|nr:LOW QUALITY PROTEIN: Chromodomain containing hypothetical protein [Phytophthora palmivora]